MSRIDTAALRDQIPISSVVAQTVPLKREGRFLKGCCPFHDDRTPSFYVSDESGRYWCMGCQAKGDIFDFVMLRDSVSFPAAAKAIGACEFRPKQHRRVPKVAKPDDNQRYAREIWDAASQVRGTPAEQYLEARGIRLDSLPGPAPLRFNQLRHPDTRQRHPALISAVCDLAGAVIGVQRTFLTDEGQKLAGVRAKLSLGDIRGGATKLGTSLDRLVVCEGLEDGLSLWRELRDVGVWIAAGGANLPHVDLPEECREVTVAADNDESGREAAHAAAEAFRQQGRCVHIMWPSPQFKDFNDQIQKVQTA